MERDVADWLSILAHQDEQSIDPAAAYRRLEQSVYRPARNYRPVWAFASAVCALALLLTFAPSRSLAQRFLEMLRIHKLAFVPLPALPDKNSAFGQMISDSMVVTLQPGKPVNVATVAEASARAGFNVATLDTLGTPTSIQIEDEGAFHMTLDGARIRALLDETGHSDVQIPASVNGSVVAAHLPKGVEMNYGDCTAKGTDCLHFLQLPVPHVSIPPGLDMRGLAEAALQFGGMSPSDAAAYAQTVDWTSTLVVPIPLNIGQYQKITVKNGDGALFQSRGHFAIVWMANGTLYSLLGNGNPARALTAVE